MAAAARKAGEQRRRSLHDLTELGAVIVLSVSALGSSYAGFQVALWEGQRATHYALAAKAQTAASREKTSALQRESVNAMHFTQWLNAYAAGNAELEAFYRDRFQPGFRTAFDEWIASRPRYNSDSPPTPFDIPGYRQMSTGSSDRLERQAEAYYRAGARDNHNSDSYGRSVVVFALALFLAGIVQGFDSPRTRAVLVALAALASLTAVGLFVSLPAIRLV